MLTVETFANHSRELWGIKGNGTESENKCDRDGIKIGCLQRIADAEEKQAAALQSLVNLLKPIQKKLIAILSAAEKRMETADRSD